MELKHRWWRRAARLRRSNRTFYGIEINIPLHRDAVGLSSNRTFYGIEISLFNSSDLLILVLIAPFMELK